MDGSSSNKRRVEARVDGEDEPDWLDVSILRETFDCGICQEPLSTVIFECWLGHFVCLSCRDKIPGKKAKKCPLCSVKTCLRRSFRMENVIHSIAIPCSNAKYGCREELAYYKKEQHEQECPYDPCFCPDSDCSFTGPTRALLNHLTTQHKYPSTVLPDSGTVSLRLQLGLNILRPCSRRTGYFFVISMSRFYSSDYAIAFFCVQPNVTLPTFTCRYKVNCPVTGYSESSRCQAKSTSFSNGLSKTYYHFILPKRSDDQVIMLRTTIRQPSGKEPTLSDCSDDDDDRDNDDVPSRFDRVLQRRSLFND